MKKIKIILSGCDESSGPIIRYLWDHYNDICGQLKDSPLNIEVLVGDYSKIGKRIDIYINSDDNKSENRDNNKYDSLTIYNLVNEALSEILYKDRVIDIEISVFANTPRGLVVKSVCSGRIFGKNKYNINDLKHKETNDDRILAS